MEAVADALHALLHVLAEVLRVALKAVRLAFGLGTAVAGHRSHRLLHRALDLVHCPAHRRSPWMLLPYIQANPAKSALFRLNAEGERPRRKEPWTESGVGPL